MLVMCWHQTLLFPIAAPHLYCSFSVFMSSRTRSDRSLIVAKLLTIVNLVVLAYLNSWLVIGISKCGTQSPNTDWDLWIYTEICKSVMRIDVCVIWCASPPAVPSMVPELGTVQNVSYSCLFSPPTEPAISSSSLESWSKLGKLLHSLQTNWHPSISEDKFRSGQAMLWATYYTYILDICTYSQILAPI